MGVYSWACISLGVHLMDVYLMGAVCLEAFRFFNLGYWEKVITPHRSVRSLHSSQMIHGMNLGVLKCQFSHSLPNLSFNIFSSSFTLNVSATTATTTKNEYMT